MRSSTYYTAALMAAAALLLSYSGGDERSESRGGPRTEEAYREMFAKFMAKYGKKTYDMAEQERRYAAFKDSEKPTRSNDETLNMFKEWMAIHGKTYDSDTEFSRRFLPFKINLERVHRHNYAAFVSFSSYRSTLDRFADLNYHEFVTRCQEPTMELEECSTTTLWA